VPKILLLTAENPSHDDYETALVAKALTELQVESDIVPRTSPSLGVADLAVIRTTWDHTQQLEDFLSVLGGMESRLSNPLEEPAVDLGDPRRRTAPAPLPATTPNRQNSPVRPYPSVGSARQARSDHGPDNGADHRPRSRQMAVATPLLPSDCHEPGETVPLGWHGTPPHCSQATVTNLVKLSLLAGTGHRHGPPEGLGPNVNAPNYLALRSLPWASFLFGGVGR